MKVFFKVIYSKYETLRRNGLVLMEMDERIKDVVINSLGLQNENIICQIMTPHNH